MLRGDRREEECEMTGIVIPCGFVRCVPEDHFSVLQMNGFMLQKLGYADIQEMYRLSGNSLITSIHTEDTAAFLSYAEGMVEGETYTLENVRVRDRDLQYHCFIFSGRRTGEELVLACIERETPGQNWPDMMRVYYNYLKLWVMAEKSREAQNSAPEQPAEIRNDHTSVRSRMQRGIYIRTFGYFDVFVNGRLIPFRYRKAKELMAVLGDRRGGFVSQGEIISRLWEDEPQNKTTLARCRKTFMRLTEELREYGIEYILDSSNGTRRIRAEMVKCDLFDYMDDTQGSSNLYHGAYMTDYSWGEWTFPREQYY